MSEPVVEIASAGIARWELGASLAACGDAILVGAPSRDYAGRIADGEALEPPCACLLVRDAGAWRLASRVTAADPLAAEGFGRAVAIGPARAAVGAPGSENGDAGVHVYARPDATSLRPDAVLDSPERGGPTNELFAEYGRAVGIDDGGVIVGAPLAGTDGAGVVYLFQRIRGTPTARGAVLRGPTPHGALGTAIAIANEVMAVGADGAFSREQLAGACLVYRRDSAAAWRSHARVDGSLPGEQFGAAVATDGHRLAVGAPGRLGHPRLGRGRVAVYELGTAGVVALGVVEDTASFGAAIAISGERLAIGHPMYTAPGGPPQTGRVGLYRIEPGGIVLDRWIDPPTTRARARLGAAVAFGPDYLAAGMPGPGGAAEWAGGVIVLDVSGVRSSPG